MSTPRLPHITRECGRRGGLAPTYTYVGATNAQGTPVARIRRIVLVKQDSAYDMADPEPAVLAARAWLEADADAYNDGL